MIYDNIDRYIEQLDLQNKLQKAEALLEEAQLENKRLIEENRGYKETLGTRNLFQSMRAKQEAKLEAMSRERESSQNRIFGILDNSAAERTVREWMNYPTNRPQYFTKWLDDQNLTYLYNLMDNPETWSPEFKKIVKTALEKIKVTEYRAMSDKGP